MLVFIRGVNGICALKKIAAWRATIRGLPGRFERLERMSETGEIWAKQQSIGTSSEVNVYKQRIPCFEMLEIYQ